MIYCSFLPIIVYNLTYISHGLHWATSRYIFNTLRLPQNFIPSLSWSTSPPMSYYNLPTLLYLSTYSFLMFTNPRWSLNLSEDFSVTLHIHHTIIISNPLLSIHRSHYHREQHSWHVWNILPFVHSENTLAVKAKVT